MDILIIGACLVVLYWIVGICTKGWYEREFPYLHQADQVRKERRRAAKRQKQIKRELKRKPKHY